MLLLAEKAFEEKDIQRQQLKFGRAHQQLTFKVL